MKKPEKVYTTSAKMHCTAMVKKKKRRICIELLLGLLLSVIVTPCFSIEESPTSKKNFNPKPASASIYNLGLKSYEQGDLESAVSYFKRAIDLDPDFIDAYFNLGAIYKKQKNYPLAINAFERAVSINPEDFEASYELAGSYLQEKNYKKAKKYFALIPPDFPKYNEAKKNLEIIDGYLALGNQGQEVKPQDVSPPNVQAQLLANTLAMQLQPEENAAAQEGSTVQAPPQAGGQILTDTLTKPSQETFKEVFKTISSNFNGPTGIAKDSSNNIYVADFTQDRIERITSDGKRETFIEKVGIKGPVGLAIDKNDNLYVANYSGDSIVKVKITISPEKEVTVLVDNIVKPYYLFYDTATSKLFATVQGSDSLIEIDITNVSKQPITAR